ncbi:MAG TPA: TetR/AcrR family transcriptional regulator [Chloroflexota bacterium]|jgi:AcrR family transcriptional regulator
MSAGAARVPADAALTPRARAKRDQIRAQAQRLFLARGFAGTSTDAIAAEAGVSKQTLYAYYPSKEELLSDVLRHLIHEDPHHQLLAPDRVRAATAAEVRQALIALAQNLIANVMQPDYLALMRVVIAETPRLPQLGALFRAAVPEQVLGYVRSILEEGQANGALAPLDTDAASRMLAGALLTYALHDGLLVGDGPPRLPPPERVEAIVQLFMKLLA